MTLESPDDMNLVVSAYYGDQTHRGFILLQIENSEPGQIWISSNMDPRTILDIMENAQTIIAAKGLTFVPKVKPT